MFIVAERASSLPMSDYHHAPNLGDWCLHLFVARACQKQLVGLFNRAILVYRTVSTVARNVLNGGVKDAPEWFCSCLIKDHPPTLPVRTTRTLTADKR